MSGTHAEGQRAALLAIRTLRAKLDAAEARRTEPIAIVGLACRFPGADDADAFWRLLVEQRDAVREIPRERYDVDALYDPDPDAPGKTYTRWAGLVDGVDAFDEEFFGISPREAAQTDPQHRLFLECTWTALEHAGIAPERLRGSATGVFAGVTLSEYGKVHDRDVALEDVSAYAVQGYASNALAGRVSHLLDLRGPSVAIDTACSSSLVAVDRACRSLREGETTVAIAGGVNVLASPEALVVGSRWGMFSPEGRCKAFADAADGFVRAEGCGVVVLKRLAQAQADGDRVLAVILGSAINHDGRSAGLTVPNGSAQQAVVRDALGAAHVEPAEVAYVEAHGTGTALGDPIEADALGAVFGASHDAERPLLIGSVKTNVGHLESAAGMAGLIKVVLALRNGRIPAQLHFDVPSRRIAWDALPLRVVDAARAWEPGEGRRVAGVSAFSFSGTNAHVVLAEAPAPARVAGAAERPLEILALSARTDTALHALAERYAHAFDARPDAWRDLCHTASAGRASFAHRLTVRGASAGAIASSLRAWAADAPDARTIASRRPARPPRIAFAFTGQGAQYAGMGRELYASSSVVRDTIDRADALLRDRLDAPLGAVMRGEHPDAERLIADTLYTQPALYALACALVALWRSLGVEPDAAIGHSVGEYAAAAASGVFTFEDGLLLVAERARLMHEVEADGAMTAIAASEADVAALLDGDADRVAIAAVNAPRNVTLSGARDAVERIAAACAARGWRTSALPVSQAFHSPLLDAMSATFEARAAAVRYAPPDRALISNVTGRALERVDAAYWRAHTRDAVRFADGLRALDALGCDAIVEIGPKPTLLPLARATLGDAVRTLVPTLTAAGRDADALADAVQRVHAAGAEIDWRAWDRDVARRIVDAPSYPFERRRHWLVPSVRRAPSAAPPAHGADAVLGTRVRTAVADAQFEREVGASVDDAWLGEHRIAGEPVAPATLAIAMMLRAGASLDVPLRALHDVVVVAPLRLGAARVVQTVVQRDASGAGVRVFAGDDDGRTFSPHAEGRLDDAPPANAAVDVAAIVARCGDARDGAEHYATLETCGVTLGTPFRRVVRTWHGEREALAEIDAAGGVDAAGRPHPALLDACLQIGSGAFGDRTGTFVPFACARVDVAAASWPSTVFAHAHARAAEASSLTVDIVVCDARGAVLATFAALRFGEAPSDATSASAMLYETRWEPAPLAADERVAPAGTWVVLADTGGVAAAVRDALAERGAPCTLVAADAATTTLSAALASGGVRAVVDCRPIDAPDLALDAEPRAVQGAFAALYGAALDVVQHACAPEAPVAVTFVTRDAAPLDRVGGNGAHDVLAALRRSAVAERPDLSCRAIDVEGGDASSPVLLAAELLHGGEPDVAYRGGRRFAARLVRATRTLPVHGPDDSLALQPAASGVLDDVAFAVRPRRAPAPHEIEVAVRANGLNFRDALQALAMLPGTSPTLGFECAGVVVRAGAASGFAPGDAVMAYCPGECASYVTVSARHAVAKPHAVSFAQAAALPIVTMTALYALERVARLRPGQTILIHAAAGGLGLAAVQLALATGATVFATAGSARKRDAVRAMGVEHVMDSRGAGFGATIAERTNGRGVDVVLNSLTGDRLVEGLRAVASGGCFIEVGKRDVLDAGEAHALRPDVTYARFELGEEGLRDDTLVPSLLARTRALVEAGALAPLPVTAYPFARASRALDDLAHARLIGKAVLAHDAHAAAIDAGATYLVTGGFGALGTRTARWLARRGARAVVLAGPRERDDARATVAELRALGVDVRTAEADVADVRAMRALVASIAPERPLRGVVHCAGTLADGTLREQSRSAFETVATPKVAGTVALHHALRGHDLDFFVLFSSAAAVLGAAGQANYAAANAAMTAVARVRRAHGQPATPIAWGPWDGAGMASSDAARRRIDAVVPFDERTGFAALDAALASECAEPVALRVPSWARVASSRSAHDRFLARLAGEPAARAHEHAGTLIETLAAHGAENRRRLLSEHVERTAAAILGLPDGARIDDDVPLHDRGLDSLMSVELRNALVKSLGVSLSPTVALDYPTIPQLVDHVLARAFSSTTLAAPADDATAIAALTDDEAEALLSLELEAADV